MNFLDKQLVSVHAVVVLSICDGALEELLHRLACCLGGIHDNGHSLARTRHLGIRPTVRGSVMNPCDHPHGGGDGKSPIGRPSPVTPWGKPAMGYKTRKKNHRTDKQIARRRNGK